jgi:hypothetical protein
MRTPIATVVGIPHQWWFTSARKKCAATAKIRRIDALK